jgi:hypothetical protein
MKDIDAMLMRQPADREPETGPEPLAALQRNDRYAQIGQFLGPCACRFEAADDRLRIRHQRLGYLNDQALGPARVETQHDVHDAQGW